MKSIKSLLLWIVSTYAYSQQVDTLSFYSEVFKEQRSIYVHKPDFYKYKSDSVKFPVIFLLDGQNNWFINPAIADIEYLRFTKEIPSSIIVVIPLKDRVKECAIPDLRTELPLDKFITEEVHKKIMSYNPNDHKTLIGHSYSASFSLYSFYSHPDYYAAVIANSPYDKLEMLVKKLEQSQELDKSRISISIGSTSKDAHHRKKYDFLKSQHPSFFEAINTFEAEYSAHNAVPIAAIPTLLTKVFEDYTSRYHKIAEVDMEYKLIHKPGSISEELNKIKRASKVGSSYYPPEISDINGIASRYWNNGLEDYAIKVYELGVKYYPNYYEFYLSLYELKIEQDKEAGRKYLEKAEHLLQTMEENWEGKNELIKEIRNEKAINGW